MKFLRFLFAALAVVVLSAAGAALAQKTDCESKITFTVCKDAAIESFSCSVKDYKKKFPSIHYAVELKNVSDQPQRFRINIFLPDGKAVGGLMPRKGDPPVLKPGETVKAEYPVKGLVDQPKTLEVLVKAISAE